MMDYEELQRVAVALEESNKINTNWTKTQEEWITWQTKMISMQHVLLEQSVSLQQQWVEWNQQQALLEEHRREARHKESLTRAEAIAREYNERALRIYEQAVRHHESAIRPYFSTEAQEHEQTNE